MHKITKIKFLCNVSSIFSNVTFTLTEGQCENVLTNFFRAKALTKISSYFKNFLMSRDSMNESNVYFQKFSRKAGKLEDSFESYI